VGLSRQSIEQPGYYLKSLYLYVYEELVICLKRNVSSPFIKKPSVVDTL